MFTACERGTCSGAGRCRRVAMTRKYSLLQSAHFTKPDVKSAHAFPRARRGNARLPVDPGCLPTEAHAARAAKEASMQRESRDLSELQCGSAEFNAPVMSSGVCATWALEWNCPLRRPGVILCRWCQRPAPVATDRTDVTGVKVWISRWPLHIRRSLEYVDCVIGQPRYKAVVEMGQRPDAACRERALGLPRAFLLSCIVGPYDDLFVI